MPTTDNDADNDGNGNGGAYPLSYQNDTLQEEAVYDSERNKPSNEYVLNVAFFSFFGFMLVQAVFALLVGSESMLADSEAMGVDAMTYLFNLCAERIKNAPPSKRELQMAPDERHHVRKMKRLYLELIPPLISVTTLITVTVFTMRDALETLFGNEEDTSAGDDEKIGVMLFFSTLNLLLDVLNVTCFARADQAFGLAVFQRQDDFRKSMSELPDELTLLVESEEKREGESGAIDVPKLSELRAMSIEEASEESFTLVNLNMCSAWTHVCADTMRSIAVLVAAAISFLFDAVTPDAADAMAAMVVSCIILVSLLPLLQGLSVTATEIWKSSRRHPRIVQSLTV